VGRVFDYKHTVTVFKIHLRDRAQLDIFSHVLSPNASIVLIDRAKRAVAHKNIGINVRKTQQKGLIFCPS